MSASNHRGRWSPYLVGAGIGVLSWIAFGVMGKALGTSTTFVRLAGLIKSTFAPGAVQENGYYAKYILDKPGIDWQMMLVVGLFVGALVSARLGGTNRVEHVPGIWKERFGSSVALRWLGAFLGGVLVLVGARLAGGCTSGHGISGGLQFALSSWVFFASFFVTGLVTAFVVYRKRGGGSHV